MEFWLVVGALFASAAVGCWFGIWVYHPPGEQWFGRAAAVFAVAGLLTVAGGVIAQAV